MTQSNASPKQQAVVSDGGGLRSHPSLRSQPEPPQPLAEAAYQGLAGEVVKAIDPHTEADPAAILAQLLAAVGNAAGRGPGFRVEADRHHCNLFVGIVGETSSARKGSSWGQARRLVEEADSEWATRIATGASSGEGLIWQVRDEIEETRKARKDEVGDAAGFITELADVGVEDKRLLVIEPELASVLERMGREGNTLSAVLRQSWDGGKLDTLVKTNRATATGAHVTLIGHITAEELRRKLTATETANGFANRFIWVYARRSKLLPFGGDLDSIDWAPLVGRLAEALRYGAMTNPLGFDSEAREIWMDAYPKLSAGDGGLLGAVTARGPAQVRRLAVIYAILDPKPDGGAIVTAAHLLAALEVWRYASDSAAFLFGDALGDETADAILGQLREAEDGALTRTAIRDLFGRHSSAREIERALSLLASLGLAERTTLQTGGRAAELWLLKDAGRDESDQSDRSTSKAGNGSMGRRSGCASHPEPVASCRYCNALSQEKAA